MITDEMGLILDSTGDGGDSANRCGLVSTFDPMWRLPLLKFVTSLIVIAIVAYFVGRNHGDNIG